MKGLLVFVFVGLSGGWIAGQERKPVPKDSVRIQVTGCSHGRVFTAGRPIEDQPGGAAVPEGTHLRMNGPRKTIAEIKAHEGSRIEITGLIRRGQTLRDGVSIGGARIGGGPTTIGGGPAPSVAGGHIMIDVEGWRAVTGDCPNR